MAEQSFQGRRASSGLAQGPLVELPDALDDQTEAAGTPAHERQRLLAAIARARAELEALAAGDAALGAEILEFQIEMLGDELLAEGALAAIAEGRAAASAWREALDPQIDAYREAEDEYFAARASDLADLRDRVLLALQGGVVAQDELPAGAILLATDLTPSRFLALDWQRLAGAALRGAEPGGRPRHRLRAVPSDARGARGVTRLYRAAHPERARRLPPVSAAHELRIQLPAFRTRRSRASSRR